MKKNVNFLSISPLLVFLFLMGCNENVSTDQSLTDIYEGIEFDMPVVPEPSFPDYRVVITDFGAVGDGQTLNTAAIEKAIDDVAEKGGGRVIIPRGVWLTGPIVLKSNVNIHSEHGALVLFSTDKDLYPLIETSFEGSSGYRNMSPIFGKDLENIAFTGDGVYDGSGDAWRYVKKYKMTDNQWEELLESGGLTNEEGDLWFPSEEYKKGYELSEEERQNLTTKEDYEQIKDYLRPVMVSLVNCKNVLLDGPVFQNSPAWNIHPLMCENIIIRNIDVRNPWYSQNGDGLDLESCKNGLVYNCTFDVGDDAICIKSGRDKEGRERGMPCENIIVKNNVVYHGHGGFTVGSEMSGGVKNMHVSKCTFIGTDVGLRFKSTRGRGGVVEKIYISDIDMIDIPTNAISFNLYYGGLSVPEMLAQKKENPQLEEVIPGVTEETPQFKDIIIKNITCKGAYQAIYLQGLPEMNLENVSLENLIMEAENGLVCMDADGITIKNLNLINTTTPALAFYNAKNVTLEDLNIPEAEGPFISINGEKTENVNIQTQTDKPKDEILKVGENVDPDEIEAQL